MLGGRQYKPSMGKARKSKPSMCKEGIYDREGEIKNRIREKLKHYQSQAPRAVFSGPSVFQDLMNDYEVVSIQQENGHLTSFYEQQLETQADNL